MAELQGRMFVGGERVAGGGAPIHGFDPRTGEQLEPGYPAGGPADVERACALADEAADTYRAIHPADRARFLDAIAERIEGLGDVLVARAAAESGLPTARLTGELARTTGQLRLFAKVVREGSWQGVRIDAGREQRPDLRTRSIALGPVAVFGASNFPLAFSVAGGDTAAALAAGCPVVVKAHEAHPGTSELVGGAVAAAVADAGLPPGVFSLLYGDGPGLGAQLVADPRIQAVAFTGSRRAGLAIAATGEAPDAAAGGRATLATVAGDHLLDGDELVREVFGATALVVRCSGPEQLLDLARRLDGQLTATVHADQDDAKLVRALLPVLERLAGRILYGGWPTGVQVGDAIVHGGPFPATTDPRTTSVGSLAIDRFLRPVCYQDVPPELLPAALRDDNPERVPRRLDGVLTLPS